MEEHYQEELEVYYRSKGPLGIEEEGCKFNLVELMPGLIPAARLMDFMQV